jgi:hypothetical protein
MVEILRDCQDSGKKIREKLLALVGYGIRYHRQDPRNHHRLSPSNLAERDGLRHNTHREECLPLRDLKRWPRKGGEPE